MSFPSKVLFKQLFTSRLVGIGCLHGKSTAPRFAEELSASLLVSQQLQAPRTSAVLPLSCCRATQCLCPKNVSNSSFRLPIRNYSTQQQDDKPANTSSGIKVKTFAIKKFMGFIDRYIKRFEQRFQRSYPRAFKIYKLFKDGVRDFWYDCKSYYFVTSGLWYGGKTLNDFSYNELDNYRQMPRDMFRVTPTLLISSLPFANYVVFPIAYMFPRHLLCRHFWTPEQRLEFGVHDLKSRLLHCNKVLSFMDKLSFDIKDLALRKLLQETIREVQLMNTTDPLVLLELLPVFKEFPLDLNSLYRHHRIHMQWHVAHTWNFRGRRHAMEEDAELLLFTDQALARRGVGRLATDALRQACLYRGLNPRGLDNEDMSEFLLNWIRVSTQLDQSTLSCLLHLNVLLSFSYSNTQTLVLP